MSSIFHGKKDGVIKIIMSFSFIFDNGVGFLKKQSAMISYFTVENFDPFQSFCRKSNSFNIINKKCKLSTDVTGLMHYSA